ncbi:MAG: TIGR02530 family flagellar biosynthesis protein [bacterium]
MVSKVSNIAINNSISQKTKVANTNAVKSFAEILDENQRNMEVRLSSHAQERLKQQNITISQQDMNRITEATNELQKKGSRESLMILRDLALVVNINNRTVITAVDKSRQKDRIFTNIDSTIIL